MYMRVLNWMPAALKMPEPELVEHAGLDSAVYIRIYLLGLKILFPITILTLVVLVPVNWTGKTLELAQFKNLTFSNIDKLSISNIPTGSKRFWAHLVMSYVCSFWTFYVLYKEYKKIATMRLEFLASECRRSREKCSPDLDESVSEHIEHFFCVNHPDHYLTSVKLAKLVEKKNSFQNWLVYYQYKYERNSANKPTIKTGFWGLWGSRVDAIDHYTDEIAKLSEEVNAERERVIIDPKAIVPAAFVSFKTRWGAAVCAQTQQSKDPTIWLTDWAPEPHDVFWDNLAIPYFELTIRRLLTAVRLFFLIFFFMIPIVFVQSLANIEGIEKVLPFLKPLIEKKVVKSVIQGFLPGIALKIFLIVLPKILMTMSKIEGFTSLSSLERRSAQKYHLFILVNVFLGSVVTGTALQQLHQFIGAPAGEFAKTIGMSVPMKVTFFITYIMVDGWAGIAAEILRMVPLVIFHLKNTFLVKTERDREQAMDPGILSFATSEPLIQLYILLGLVYSVITPVLLPFIVAFFAFSYLIFRHQIINVYDQKYESGASFWPDVHRRIIIGLIIAQIIHMGLLGASGADKSTTPCLIAQPILTLWFYIFCKGRFESAFVRFPLQDFMVKETLERTTEPSLNLKTYLQDAYIHPVFKGTKLDIPVAIDEENNPLVPTKRTSCQSSVHSFDVSSEADL
ncbi:hypothetical protein SO802_030107 [Lithocarpus litseifolius]|uniref:CSC1-like protein At4g02900 n=1 Tax=Lithocarpus litseifolius TaxID=425828 RepID=A0AAW2BX70_9ROSI